MTAADCDPTGRTLTVPPPSCAPAGVKGVLSSSDYVDEKGVAVSFLSVVTDMDI